jgi:hypothetical protein
VGILLTTATKLGEQAVIVEATLLTTATKLGEQAALAANVRDARQLNPKQHRVAALNI